MINTRSKSRLESPSPSFIGSKAEAGKITVDSKTTVCSKTLIAYIQIEVHDQFSNFRSVDVKQSERPNIEKNYRMAFSYFQHHVTHQLKSKYPGIFKDEHDVQIRQLIRERLDDVPLKDLRYAAEEEDIRLSQLFYDEDMAESKKQAKAFKKGKKRSRSDNDGYLGSEKPKKLRTSQSVDESPLSSSSPSLGLSGFFTPESSPKAQTESSSPFPQCN